VDDIEERTTVTAHSDAPTPSRAAGQPTMEGRVRSGSRPLAEVIVTLTDRAGVQVARCVTGPDGGFRLTGLAAGSYVMIFSRAGYHPYATTAVFDPARSAPLDVPLAASTSLRGVVHDAHSGRPVAAATVTAVGPDGNVIAATVSDPDGGYRLAGIDADEITLAVAAPAADPFATVVRLGAGGPEHVVDVPLDTFSTLSGTVTVGGRPACRLHLTLHDHSGRAVATTVTDDHGGYRFERLTAGTYTLTGPVSPPRSAFVGPDTCTADLLMPGP
jgi:hypothetical protein